MALKLPPNPTPKQIDAMTLALIRNVFEPNATDLGEVVGDGKGGWSTTYTANGQKFEISYTPKDGFLKGPVGNSPQFAESDLLADAEWDALADAVADPEQQDEIIASAMQALADLTD